MSVNGRGSRASSSQRVVSSFPQKQWDIFERICQDQANMDGRKALKHLVAHCAMTGNFPMANPSYDQQEEMNFDDPMPSE